METAIIGLIALVLACGVGGGLLTTWSIHRRTYRLEYRVTDLEELLLREKNKAKALTRWDKQKRSENELEEFMASVKTPAPSRPVRQFANDPLEPDEHGALR